MTSAILIDPKKRTVREITPPPEPPPATVIEGLGRVCYQPLSPFQEGIHPFYLDHLGLMFGPVMILDPEKPVEPLITWVSTLMILSGATLIIPETHHA